jgi:hypothetical protein
LENGGRASSMLSTESTGKMAMASSTIVVTIGLALGYQGSPETHHRRSREPQS